MDKDTVAHPDQVNTRFCVVLASIESFDGKWVPEDPDRLVELKAMLAPVKAALSSSHSNSSAMLLRLSRIFK
jgi:hypothetical protein